MNKTQESLVELLREVNNLYQKWEEEHHKGVGFVFGVVQENSNVVSGGTLDEHSSALFVASYLKSLELAGLGSADERLGDIAKLLLTRDPKKMLVRELNEEVPHENDN